MSDQPLPISGPLGRRQDYNPTNRDLYDNALKQNKVINQVHLTVAAVDTKVQTLATTVASHAKVIDLLTSIKTIALWLLAFLGLGGLGSIAAWLKIWLTH
jgi:hypothetical protein